MAGLSQNVGAACELPARVSCSALTASLSFNPTSAATDRSTSTFRAG